jgi:hypothetical protein
LVSITAQGISMCDAHIAASIRAGSAMPFPRLVCRWSIVACSDVIGRRTGTRGIPAGGLTGRRGRRPPPGRARRPTRPALLGISLGGRHLRAGIGLRRSGAWRHPLGVRLTRQPGCRSQSKCPRPLKRSERVSSFQSPNNAPPNFFNAPSHKRREFRSPALASSTICLAMIPFAKSSASPRAARVRSSATSRTRMVSASSKSPK